MMPFEGLRKLLKKRFAKKPYLSKNSQSSSEAAGNKRKDEHTEWVSYYIN